MPDERCRDIRTDFEVQPIDAYRAWPELGSQVDQAISPSEELDS